ncbi:MAG: phospholipid carrier-dependent glycosyltransferase, partial [Cyanothece sp. SIO2G6]|nr:phospholipid carrier-dependent glycosyltransferase [Cyanothece sp. SIO2G6]
SDWTYYWQQLPQAISYPILIVASVGLIIALIRFLSTQPLANPSPTPSLPHSPTPPLLWLILFLLPPYIIWAAIANKDSRYILPWLSWWSVLLAYGLLCFPRKWRQVKWLTVMVAVLVMLLNLFPLGGDWGRAIATTLAPGAYQPPYWGDPWPHKDVIDEIITTQPYQISNIGVLPSTPTINQHNFTLEGNRRNFQVYARRMGRDRDYLERDWRSLSWFLAVTAPNLNHHEPSSRRRQRQILNDIKQSGEFKRQRVWSLPDGSRLLLFRRKRLPVEVKPLDNPITDVLYDNEKLNTALTLFGSQNRATPSVAIQPLAVQLDAVNIPNQNPPGQAIPVTYTWSGSWSMLHDGMVLLNWQLAGTEMVVNQQGCQPDACWLHDHAIGLGMLYPQIIQANQAIAAPLPSNFNPLQPFTVTEHTAMLPPATLKPGRYTLAATYLNRITGETDELEVPPVQMIVNPTAKAKAAPELDWITQFRQAALQLPLGIDVLNQVFDNLGRINLYDPVQAYTQQAEIILKARLQRQPENVADYYGLVLAQALQRDVQGTIAALEQVTQLDADNPYVHAQLGFVRLYAGRPWAAQRALDQAIALDPTVPEIQTLNTIAALMRGNLWQAWNRWQS